MRRRRVAAAIVAQALAPALALSLAAPTASAQPAQAAPMIIRPSATLGPPPANVPGGRTGSTGAATGGQPAGGSPPRGAAAIGGGHPGLAPGASPGAPPATLRGLPNRFRSVAKPETVLFDAPSERARKLFVAPAGMPVEVISVLRDWVKLRDPLGDLGWVTRDMLADRRTVVSLVPASVRRDPQADAPILFDVDRGVLFDLVEDRPSGAFVKVRYAGGEVGYLQTDQVWGL